MRPRRAKPGPAAKETRATMRREPRGALTLASPAPLRDAMMTCKRLLSIRADAAAPGKARPGGERTQGYNAPQPRGALTLASPAPLRDAMMTCKRLLSIRADAAAP